MVKSVRSTAYWQQAKDCGIGQPAAQALLFLQIITSVSMRIAKAKFGLLVHQRPHLS
jgi:hypothetical protein